MKNVSLTKFKINGIVFNLRKMYMVTPHNSCRQIRIENGELYYYSSGGSLRGWSKLSDEIQSVYKARVKIVNDQVDNILLEDE